MRTLQIFCLMLVAWNTAALADASADCTQHTDHDLAILACTTLIDQDLRNAIAYYSRGNAHKAKGDLDRAIADYTRPSSSIRNTRSPITAAASPIAPRKTLTQRLQTSPGQSRSILS